jgi:K+/H+ antiporter YhaU regulatory subunit KhtT
MKHSQRAGMRHVAAGPARPRKPSIRKETSWGRLRYRLDNALSRGPFMVIGWLAAVTATLILTAALVLEVFRARVNHTRVGIVEGIWQSMLRVIDPGTMAGDSGWPLRITALFVTISGIFLASALIGIVAAGIDRQIEQLRRGRSAVLENGHTLVLGWSPRVFIVVSELCVANENQSKPRIVVMAKRDKVEMEHDLLMQVPDRGPTRLVCRTGDPANLDDLDIVRTETARSIIVLGDGDRRSGDAEVVKVVLALLAKTSGRDTPIVAEVWDEEIAHALRRAGRGRVRCVRSSDVIARITAQACRQAGLSSVCQELLDFEGDEIYFSPVAELVGHTFGESLLAFEHATVIGVRTAEGKVVVNPSMTRVFAPDDQVVVVCEDDDRVVFTGWRSEPVDSKAVCKPPKHRTAERILLTGWNPLAPMILRELDAFAAPGTRVDLLVDSDLVAGEPVQALVDAIELRNLEVSLTLAKVDLEALAPRLDGCRYDHVVVLGYRGALTPSEADARTMLTMLLLQQHGAGRGFGRVVAEILDSRDVDLAQVTGADDFVVSDALSGLMIAQLAENPELEEVFVDLFDAAGSALMVRDCGRYVTPGADFMWREVVHAAASVGDIAIGHYCAEGDPGLPVVNPSKSSRVTLREGDHVIVIGEPG